jgi:hypothetical protein
MLVLFDNGTPRTLVRYLIDHHAVTEARARGWDELENGALLNAAEAAGFDVLVTTDKNLSYQQDLSSRKIAIVVLGQGRWSLINAHVSEVVAAPGSYTLVEIPYASADRRQSRGYCQTMPSSRRAQNGSVRINTPRLLRC